MMSTTEKKTAPLTEKYRPMSLDDVVGQDEVVRQFRSLAHRFKEYNEMIPHMNLIGPPGVGKTTIAKALAHEIWEDEWESHFKEFNASDSRKIEDVRTRYKRIAGHSGYRIVYLSEADQMTRDAQHAMRRIMETTKGTIFILSGNNEGSIIDAVGNSRCAKFRFNRLKPKEILRHILNVAKAEGIKVDIKDKDIQHGLKALVKEADGDMRRALNILQIIQNEDKEITVENILYLIQPTEAINAMMKAIEGDFVGARELIEDSYIQSGYDHNKIIREWKDGTAGLNDDMLQARLSRELASTDADCQHGNTVVVQLIGFISYCYIAPRLSKCPGLDRP